MANRLVSQWVELPAEHRDYGAVSAAAIMEVVGLDYNDIIGIEHGTHITNRQEIYKVHFIGGIDIIVYGSRDGMRFLAEGGSY